MCLIWLSNCSEFQAWNLSWNMIFLCCSVELLMFTAYYVSRHNVLWNFQLAPSVTQRIIMAHMGPIDPLQSVCIWILVQDIGIDRSHLESIDPLSCYCFRNNTPIWRIDRSAMLIQFPK